MKQLWISLLIAMGASGYAHSQVSAVVPPDEAIDGVSQRELSIKWWQWAASFDPANSPVADKTGSQCAARQEGKVWMLAGTFGTARATRTCTVPAGRTLFFPLANYIVFAPAGSRAGCRELIAEAASLTDGPQALVLELNGVRLELATSHRQPSMGCFDLEAMGRSPKGFGPAASNGYYVALRPLPKGTHTLNFGAILPSIQQAVTYTLNVE